MGVVISLFTILLILFVLVLSVAVVVMVLGQMFKGIGWTISHISRFVGGTFRDFFGILGAVITSLVLMPIVLANIAIGRWSAASHFGRALEREMGAGVACAYRLCISNPAHFLLLGGLLEGIEQRIPADVKGAPSRDKPTAATGKFEGYKIVGTLPGGGSGAKLYVAQPLPHTLERIERSTGRAFSGAVVIKSFSVATGSSLPQIVRESRSLEPAKRLGLVLDHELTDARFFYVMPYVPGDRLSELVTSWHARCGREGLDAKHMRAAVAVVADLLRTLTVYHDGGLWHKDVKPDNIIVNEGRAHLVDMGLLTPIRSAMTLTTHGTEYFRDPEMVRMAMAGTKVRDVQAARFDLYAAGAVLFSVVEGSFPAHGGLSTIGKKCPEAIRWIVRRAMTDLDRRYPDARAMLGDLEVVLAADDLGAVRPADLPSVSGKPAPVGAGAGDVPIAAQLVPQEEVENKAFCAVPGRCEGANGKLSCKEQRARRKAERLARKHGRTSRAGGQTVPGRLNMGIVVSVLMLVAMVGGAFVVVGDERRSVGGATFDDGSDETYNEVRLDHGNFVRRLPDGCTVLIVDRSGEGKAATSHAWMLGQVLEHERLDVQVLELGAEQAIEAEASLMSALGSAKDLLVQGDEQSTPVQNAVLGWMAERGGPMAILWVDREKNASALATSEGWMRFMNGWVPEDSEQETPDPRQQADDPSVFRVTIEQTGESEDGDHCSFQGDEYVVSHAEIQALVLAVQQAVLKKSTDEFATVVLHAPYGTSQSAYAIISEALDAGSHWWEGPLYKLEVQLEISPAG